MPMTTQQVLDLLDGMSKPGPRGRAEAMRRFAPAKDGRGSGRPQLPHNQAQLLAAVRQGAATRSVLKYRHPAVGTDMGPGNRHDSMKRKQPLTAAEIAWLNRLPSNPAKVTFDDAHTVFALLGRTNRSDPAQRADLPLLHSIATPLRTYHDRKQADANLAHAEQKPLPVPSQAFGALVEAIEREFDGGLHDDEIATRAHRLLVEHQQKHTRDRSAAISQAQQAIRYLDSTEADRARVDIPDGSGAQGLTFSNLAGGNQEAIDWARYRADHGDAEAQRALDEVRDAYAALEHEAS